jgi:hypothetical protein
MTNPTHRQLREMFSLLALRTHLSHVDCFAKADLFGIFQKKCCDG